MLPPPRPFAQGAAHEPGEARQDEHPHEPTDGDCQLRGVERRPREFAQAFRALGHPVPGRVAHQHRQNDGCEALRDQEAEQDFQRRDEEHEHEQLTELDTEVEREQRRQQMGPGELQRFAERERESNPWTRPNPKVINQRRLTLLPRTFSIAMYRMEIAISVSMRGGNHSASGPRLYAEAISVIECATVNEVTSSTSCPNLRNGITKQSRNSRWSVPSRMWKN